MNGVLNNLKTGASEKFTENGDLAYSTTYNSNLDFFFASSLFRSHSDIAVQLFSQAFLEDKGLAVKNLAYLRDVKGGLGFRDATRAILVWLGENDAATLMSVLDAFIQLGRWDDILPLIFVKNAEVVKFVKDKVYKQFHSDLMVAKKGEGSVSLLAKWLPKINSTDFNKRKLAYAWANTLFKGSRRDAKYRRNVKAIRRYIGLIETHLVEKDYTFDYTKIPGRALAKYNSAFVTRDSERYQAYRGSLKVEGSVAAEKLQERVKALYPYEIMLKAESVQKDEVEMAEAMWKALPQAEVMQGNVLSVYDSSYSMSAVISGANASIADIARSLAIYTSERLSGPFKDKVVTFSAQPRFVDLSKTDGSLAARSKMLTSFSIPENTNLKKLFDLILKSSIGANPEDYIDTILLVTDCEFDNVTNYQGLVVGQSTFQNAKHKFEEEGIPLPKIVYWNLNSKRLTIPISHGKLDQEKVILVSGFSTHILNSISKNEFKQAEEVMYDALAKYDYLLDLLK